MKKKIAPKIQGMFVLVDRGNIKGLEHWIRDFKKRGLPALIQIDEQTLNQNCRVLKELSDKLFEFGIVYNERPFWDEPFNNQYEIIQRLKHKSEECTDKPTRVFQSKYLAYNEATLQVADKLGIHYILARGTTGEKSIVYKPREYNAKIISVSNVPSKHMGSGTLCDHSLWCRTETPADFSKILSSLKANRIVLVAQTYLSGIKLNWWNVYQDFLNANIVEWQSLDEFVTKFKLLSYEKIPINTVVEYVTPKPKIPLEQEPDCQFET